MKIHNSRFVLTKIMVVGAVFLLSCSGHQHHEEDKEEENEVQTIDSEPVVKVNVFEQVDSSVKTQINGLYKDYAEMIDALAEDHLDQAKTASRKFSEDIQKFDMSKLNDVQMNFYNAQSARLTATLQHMDAGADIEQVRMELESLSETIYILIKTYQANEAALYYNFCPMARNNEGAYWLSGTKEIKNPYMGQQMLTCGITKEIINLNH